MTDTINVPESFIQNTTITWVDTFDDFPAPEYVLTYTWVNTTTTITTTAAQSGSTSSHEVTPDTSGFTPGDWKWQILATETASGNKSIVGYGTTRVGINYAEQPGGVDNRLIEERILEQVNNWLLNLDNVTEQKITYQDMEVWNTDIEKLESLRDKLQRDIAYKKQAKSRKFMRTLRFNLP